MEGSERIKECGGLEEDHQETERHTDDSSSPEFPTFVLKDRDIDRGWAWLAMFSSFVSLMLEGLCLPMIGIMYVHQLETFEKNPALTACIGSLMISLMVICGPISAWVSRRYGRQLCLIAGGVLVSVSLAISSQSYNFWLVFVTNGLLAGFGLGLITTAAFFNIGCYFVRRRSLASGICAMGFPVGVFLSPPIIQYLEYIYGWRGALLIFAGIQLNFCVMGVIMYPSPIDKYYKRLQIEYSIEKTKEKSNEDLVIRPTIKRQSVYTNIPFYFFAMSFLFTNFSINVVYIHLPRFIYSRGGTAGDIQSLYSVLGMAGAASRLLTGLASGTLKNGISVDKISLLLGSFSIVGAALYIFPIASAYSQSYGLLCMFFVGFYYNVEIPVYVPICMETVGFSNLADALGLIFFLEGFGNLSGPPLAAFLATRTGNYDNVFYLTGLANFLAVLCLVTMLLLKPRRTTKSALSSTNSKVRGTDENNIDNET